MPRGRKASKVQCVETSQIYDNVKVAAEAIDRDFRNLYRALVSGGKCARNHWIYYTEKQTENWENN